jgi:hypothetical protein
VAGSLGPVGAIGVALHPACRRDDERALRAVPASPPTGLIAQALLQELNGMIIFIYDRTDLVRAVSSERVPPANARSGWHEGSNPFDGGGRATAGSALRSGAGIDETSLGRTRSTGHRGRREKGVNTIEHDNRTTGLGSRSGPRRPAPGARSRSPGDSESATRRPDYHAGRGRVSRPQPERPPHPGRGRILNLALLRPQQLAGIATATSRIVMHTIGGVRRIFGQS